MDEQQMACRALRRNGDRVRGGDTPPPQNTSGVHLDSLGVHGGGSTPPHTGTDGQSRQGAGRRGPRCVTSCTQAVPSATHCGGAHSLPISGGGKMEAQRGKGIVHGRGAERAEPGWTSRPARAQESPPPPGRLRPRAVPAPPPRICRSSARTRARCSWPCRSGTRQTPTTCTSPARGASATHWCWRACAAHGRPRRTWSSTSWRCACGVGGSGDPPGCRGPGLIPASISVKGRAFWLGGTLRRHFQSERTRALCDKFQNTIEKHGVFIQGCE